jgi:hypothetical protein
MTSTLRACLSFAGVLSAVTSHSQQGGYPNFPKSLPPQIREQLTIDRAGRGLWHSVPISAKGLAGKADDWLVARRGASATTRYIYEGPRGFGFSVGDVFIDSPLRFRAQFAHLIEGKPTHIFQATMIADGSRISWEDRVTFGHPQPVKASRLPPDLFDRWATEYPRFVFAGFGTSDKPLSAYVAAATAAGLRTAVQERDTNVAGHVFRLLRVFIDKPGATGAKLYQTEIIVDRSTYALLTIRNARGSKASLARSLWSIKWSLTPGQTGNPAWFQIPAK